MAYSIDPNPNVPYEVRYADEYLLVVDKPVGVVTQPGKKHGRDSLLNGLFVEYGKLLQRLGEARSWGLLHRLDKPTSGLVYQHRYPFRRYFSSHHKLIEFQEGHLA